MLRSLVRPDRISSPMTSMAAVTISAIERLRENDLRQITRRLRSAMGKRAYCACEK